MIVCSFAMKCTFRGSTWTRHFPFLVDTEAFIAMHCIKVGGKQKVHVTFPFFQAVKSGNNGLGSVIESSGSQLIEVVS